MGAIEDELLEWAAKRPAWQRNLLKRVARGEEIGAVYVTHAAQQIAGGEVLLEEPVLALSDFSAGGTKADATRLNSIGSAVNINALLASQELRFGADGLTVVYGDNGSGKSGYARIAKDVFGARHQEAVLPNAYEDNGAHQSATISFSVAGQDHVLEWPERSADQLRRGHFYDEACGNDYLENDTTLAYRPSVLSILDRLAASIDDVKTAVGQILREAADSDFTRPDVPVGTCAATLLDGLSAMTSAEDIETTLTVPPASVDDLAKLRAEEARLRATDPGKERERLASGSEAVGRLADHLEAIETRVSESAGRELLTCRDDAQALRTAADAASESSFSDEPLLDVGSGAWRVLWEAAERYSSTSAYPDDEFPATDEGHRCVLCQQVLDHDARTRLRRFHGFVANEVAQKASNAEIELEHEIGVLEALQVSDRMTSAAVRFLEAEDEDLSVLMDLALAQAERARLRILQRVRDQSEEELLALVSVDVKHLRELSSSANERAEKSDSTEFLAKLKATEESRAELEGKVIAGKHRDAILAEVDRKKEESRLRSIHTAISTMSTTTFANDLAARYVTEEVKTFFAAEAKRLKLEHVALGDRPGSKAQVRHRPTLEGAGRRAPRDVLSEGEQTAAGLVGLFTEVAFDDSRSVVVMDDPVTSLDHDRRAIVAARLVEFASDRQIVVFTHDLVFLGELSKAAANAKVEFCERAVGRTGDGRPGHVEDGLPWKAKDAKQRIHELSTELEAISKNASGMKPDAYDDATALWSGRLSQLWERIVRSEIAYRVVDRSTTEIHMDLFRVFTRVSDDDEKDFRQGFKAASDWAARHDPSEEVNRTAPAVAEMEAELARVTGFFGRVKKYAEKHG